MESLDFFHLTDTFFEITSSIINKFSWINMNKTGWTYYGEHQNVCTIRPVSPRIAGVESPYRSRNANYLMTPLVNIYETTDASTNT
jgi:hypothetical protein